MEMPYDLAKKMVTIHRDSIARNFARRDDTIQGRTFEMLVAAFDILLENSKEAITANWIKHIEKSENYTWLYFQCSNCGAQCFAESMFCPNCGADMKNN